MFCLVCKEKIFGRKRIYCSRKCYNLQKYITKIKEFNDGNNLLYDTRTIKKILLLEYGESCQECMLSVWNDKPIPLEIEHINGDFRDNTKQNLRLLCPNCHSLTDTYKSKNRGNGRHTRMHRYHQGKSF